MQMTNQTHNAPHIGQVMMAVERPGIGLLRFGQRKTVWPSSNSVFPIPNTIFRDTKSAMVGHSHCAPTAHLRQRWYCCESALSFFFSTDSFSIQLLRRFEPVSVAVWHSTNSDGSPGFGAELQHLDIYLDYQKSDLNSTGLGGVLWWRWCGAVELKFNKAQVNGILKLAHSNVCVLCVAFANYREYLCSESIS